MSQEKRITSKKKNEKSVAMSEKGDMTNNLDPSQYSATNAK